MSYCRWSSNDFTSDVYVYASGEDGEITIHVGGRRYAPVQPMPPPPAHADDEAWIKRQEAWIKRQMVVMDIIRQSPTVPIGLPADNQTFIVGDADDAVIKLLELRDMGYQIPQGCIDALEDEYDEVRKDS